MDQIPDVCNSKTKQLVILIFTPRNDLNLLNLQQKILRDW